MNWHSTWVCSDGLDHGPDKEDEDNVVDDEEDYDSDSCPGVDYENQKFDDAEIEEGDDYADYYQEQRWAVLTAPLHHSKSNYILNQSSSFVFTFNFALCRNCLCFFVCFAQYLLDLFSFC